MQTPQPTTVLVTGGAGFIGSTIVDRLVERGFRTVVVDDLSSGRIENLANARASGQLTMHTIDIRSPDLRAVLEEERPDAVLHLAAQIDVRSSVADPINDATINVVGTLNVMEASRATGVRRVAIASSGGCVYGEPKRLPVAETARGRPVSPYGISKRVLHDYLEFYRATYGLESVVLALSNVYGPRQDPHGEAGVVAIFLGAMLRGEPSIIFGDGRQTRDFVFVEDVAEAFLLSMTRGRGVFNIGTGVETSVLELWDACARVTGYQGQPGFKPARAGELERSAMDWTRAKRSLGWAPGVGLEEGLAATARFIGAAVEGESDAAGVHDLGPRALRSMPG